MQDLVKAYTSEIGTEKGVGPYNPRLCPFQKGALKGYKVLLAEASASMGVGAFYICGENPACTFFVMTNGKKNNDYVKFCLPND